MVNVGAHVSISGGVQKAVEREADLGGTTGQIFVGSPRGWAVSDIPDDEAAAFREAAEETGIGPWIVHGTYLVNLATPKDDLAEKSLDCVQAELDACGKLDLPYYVFHPGAHTGAGAETGVGNVAERISTLDVPEGTTFLLENTAGKGTTVGKTFGQLARMVEESTLAEDEVGVCLDTCHLFAAGYDFRTDEGLEKMLAELDDELGLDRVEYLHLNDSKHPMGSEKDEHEHIGEGEIGEAGFERFLTADDFADLPMVLETPEGDEKGYAWNIEKVQDLAT
ncbi:MAG: deoxyribonuclease IV [Halorientalis sp.]